MVSLAHLSYSLFEPSVKDRFAHLADDRTRALVIKDLGARDSVLQGGEG